MSQSKETSQYEIEVTYKVVRSVSVTAGCKSEARKKALAHDVDDVDDDWDLTVVSAGRAIPTNELE